MATTSARPSDPARTQISPTRLACRESVAFNTGSPVFSSLCIYLSFLSTSEIGPIRLSVFAKDDLIVVLSRKPLLTNFCS